MKNIRKIDSIDTLEEALNSKQAFIFKNSPLCPISTAAKREFQEFAQKTDNNIELYSVDVISSRNLSQDIERRTGITHQSPQVILIKNGKPAWNASHWNITTNSLKEAVQ